MNRFNVGDRVYHRRKNESDGREGFGTILEIDGIKARLLWEDSELQGWVDIRDILPAEQAESEGIV
jgi:hypothetical protein